MITFSFKFVNLQKCLILRRTFNTLHSKIMPSLNVPPKELKIKTTYGHLAIKVWNETGKRTPILALHGWMDNAGTWDNLCPLLDEDYPVYALDFPGHGFSSHPPTLGTYYTDHVVAVDKVIHHFNWKQVILLGHSMGGGVSLLYSGTLPHMMKKVIVVDIFHPVTVAAKDQPRRTAASLKELLRVEEKLKTDPPRYTYEEITQKLVESYGNSVNEDAAKTLLVRNSRRHEDGKYSFTYSPVVKIRSTLSLTFDLIKAYFSRISCDMLLIKSLSSQIYGTKEQAREVLNLYKQTSKNFVFEVVEGTHHVHLVNPEPVAKLINDFLHGVPQSDESKSRSDDFIKSHL